jgi:hypothetical protein
LLETVGIAANDRSDDKAAAEGSIATRKGMGDPIPDLLSAIETGLHHSVTGLNLSSLKGGADVGRKAGDLPVFDVLDTTATQLNLDDHSFAGQPVGTPEPSTLILLG